MSKLSIVTLIACAVSIPSAMAQKWFNGDPKGNIVFNGTVLANSCKIENSGYKNVTLNPVINTRVNSQSPEQIKEFTIKVTDCHIDEYSIPKLSWGKNYFVTTDGYLKNNIIFGGSNAALALQDKNGTNIDLSKDNNKFDPERTHHSEGKQFLEYKFRVGYIRSSDTPSFMRITPGSVQMQANYRITYN
ncbi:fimbrial protein [Citrobacter tructae]|jgi:type 1 fimbria pilin|uniref:Type 1 fimbrial protein n=1 Tax=Citrobacter tructae TaxID=2562449 RepID=A0ABX5T6C0_9ENTR|nr:fimbrial protein [Citrobacter tructae]QBX82027.1 type 1 fimbrial protein [Citrobacter tructae]